MTSHAVTANRLTDGQVVSLTPARTWSEKLHASQLADGHRAYRVCFELFTPKEQAAAVAARQAKRFQAEAGREATKS